MLNPLVRSTAVPTPPRPVGPSARPAGRSRHSLRRLSAVAFAVGLLVMTGCADLPTNYNERAEENFMVGCKDGGSAEYCRSLADIPDSVGRAFDAILQAQYTAEVELASGKSGTVDLVVIAEGRTIHSRPRRQFSQKGR